MLRKRKHLAQAQVAGKRGVARSARGILDALARCGDRAGADCVDRHAMLCGERGAMRGPLRAVGVQAVIDVQGSQSAFARRRERSQGMQQHARIQATTESDDDRTRRQAREA